MTTISCLGLNEAAKWDEIVRSFHQHDVYNLSGYVRAFQLHGDGEPLLIHYDDGTVRGFNVVMRRDVADDTHFLGKIDHNMRFDFITPYGYGGWIIEGTETSKLFASYEDWCRDNRIVSEFVRFHPVLCNHCQTENVYDVIALGPTICMDLSSPERIWSNLSSKNRNMIRKAMKNGITIEKGRSDDLFDAFRIIYNKTMDKDNAAAYYYFSQDFYTSIRNDLSNSAQVFYAKLESGTIIAASIILHTNRRLNYHLSGSLREFQHLAPTNLLLYEAALWGSEQGYDTFHLGGGVGSTEDSLFAFKKSFFKGLPKRFHIGKKIFMHDAYNNLVAIRGNDVRDTQFFPQYRAI